jgi:hypothetical protein
MSTPTTWRRARRAATAGAELERRVVLSTQGAHDMLEVRLDDSAAALSVAAALEQGIQLAFQLDGSELGSYVFEDDSGGARVLLYETDEGGIGVLAALDRGGSAS